MEMFGDDFSGYNDNETQTSDVKATSADPSKAKKGKLNAKSTGLTYQFQILELLGVPREEIKQFADPHHWLHYFPPIAKHDLNHLGARIDWRRQFLTSESNWDNADHSRRKPLLRLFRSVADEQTASTRKDQIWQALYNLLPQRWSTLHGSRPIQWGSRESARIYRCQNGGSRVGTEHPRRRTASGRRS